MTKRERIGFLLEISGWAVWCLFSFIAACAVLGGDDYAVIMAVELAVLASVLTWIGNRLDV